MTITLRLVVTAASILTAAMVLRKIRKSQLQIEDSIFWIGFCFILVVFALFPWVPDMLSKLAGTYTTANFIYMAVIFLLIVKLFQMTLAISKLESQIKRLVQDLALERHGRDSGEEYPVRESSGLSERKTEEKKHGTD